MAQANAQSIIHIDPRASARLRKRLEDAVEKVITALDAFTTPAEDLEDGGDNEPSADAEPSLAFTNDIDQTKAARHASRAYADEDLEHEHDGREPEIDEIGHVAVEVLP